MSERQVDYVDDSGNVVTTLTFAEGTTNEEINEYVSTYADEIEISVGVREPGFGPVTMGLVPESFERGLYDTRQIAGALGSELGLLEPETVAEDYAKMQRYKQYSVANLDKEEITDLETVRQAFQDSEKATGGVVDTVSAFFSPFLDNPDAIGALLGQTLGVMTPALAITAAGAAVGGYPGLVIASFLGSGATEYGSTFTDAFGKVGVDVNDNEAVLQVLSDPEKLDEVRKEASIRGITVGTFDALTLGFAGKLSKLIKGNVSDPKLLGRVGAGGAAEFTLQAAGGAGGEATSQALTGRYEPGEIIAEALIEGVTTPVDIALAARARGTNKTKVILEGSGLTPTAINEFDSKPKEERERILNDLVEGDESKVVAVQKELNMTEDEIIAAKPFISQSGEDVVASEFLEEKIIEEDEGFNPADIEGLKTNPAQATETLIDVNTTQLELDLPSSKQPRGAVTRTETDTKVIEKQVDSQGKVRVIEKIKGPSVEKSQASTILERLDLDANQLALNLEMPETKVVAGVDVTNNPSAEAAVDAHVNNTSNKPVQETSESGKSTPVIAKLKQSVNSYNKAVARLDNIPLTAPRRRALEKEVDRKAQQIKEDAQKVYPASPSPLTNVEVNQVQQAVATNQPLPTFKAERVKVESDPTLTQQVAEGLHTYGDLNQTENSPAKVNRAVAENDANNQTALGEPVTAAEESAIEDGTNLTEEAINEADNLRLAQAAEAAELSTIEAADKSAKFNWDPYKIKASFIDLSLWDGFIKFPDMLAKKYPAFSPLFNAIKIRSSLVNTKMAEILQPFDFLKNFSRTELHNTLKAVVVLDQLGSIRIDAEGAPLSTPYASENGGLVVEEKNNEGNFVIKLPSKEIIKANELDMSILEDPTTGSGLLEVVTDSEGNTVTGIELTENELKGVQNIFIGMKTATEGVVQASMPEFNFTSGTTISKLGVLIKKLETIQSNKETFSSEGLTEAEAARQVSKDSGLVVDINDPSGAFKEGSSVPTMIEALKNFQQMLYPIQSNPFYIPHRRPGRIGIAVKANNKTLWMQSIDLKELRNTLKLNLPFDQGVASTIPLSKTPTNIVEVLESKGIRDIKRELEDKVKAGVFGDDTTGIKVEAFDMYENKFASALSLKDIYTAESVFETILSSMVINPEDGTKVGTSKQEKNKQFNDEFKKILQEGKKKILARGSKGIAPVNQINRKNVPGWIRQENLVDNLLESLTVHAARASGYIATQKTETILQKGVDNLTGLQKLHKYGENYKASVDSGAEDFAHMRRIAFHYFLGLNPASAFVNLTQIPMSAFPYLAHHSSGGSASKEILSALRDAGKIAGIIKGLKRTGTATVAELIEVDFKDIGLTDTADNRLLWENIKIDLKNGRLMAQVTAEQLGMANFGAGQVFKSSLGRLENISSAIFTYAELINRMTTYIAAHRTYTKGPKFKIKIEKMLENNPDFQSMKGLEKSLGQDTSPARLFAGYTVDQTQFYMGVENRPEFMRGPVFGILTQFMQFPARYLQMITNLAFDSQAVKGKRLGQYKDAYIKERAGALASMGAFMLFTGGFWSLPLAQQSGDLYDKMYKLLYGVDPVIRVELQKQLMQLGIDSPEYFTRGVLPQLLNISLANRTGAGVVIQPEMFSGDYTKAWGPAGSMIFGSMANAVTNLHRGDYTKAFANLAPTFAYNASKAWAMSKDGYSTTNRGRLTSPSVDIGVKDIAAQAVGFRPESLAAAGNASFDIDRQLKRSNEKSQIYRDQLKSERSKYYINNKIFERTGSRAARTKSIQHITNFNSIVQDIIEYNNEVLADSAKDSTYLINLTPQTLKSINKGAAADAGIIYKPGPRKSRGDELNVRWYSGSPTMRRELEKRFGPLPR